MSVELKRFRDRYLLPWRSNRKSSVFLHDVVEPQETSNALSNISTPQRPLCADALHDARSRPRSKDNVLTISGERTAPQVSEGARWHRRERGYGKFSRAIRLPFAASDDKVEARMTNGVLRIVISRPEEEKPKKIEIKAA